ncbi:MAG: dienelactone hydrolase family protein [Alphaproteobacteria bacterium]|nr:dienelactone hydrolase family protein [Alphaproteobacteria bacterium]
MTRKSPPEGRPARPTQAMLDLYDKYAHGLLSRRDFFDRLSGFAVGGVTVAALAELLLPDYAQAQQVREEDPRISGSDITYASPEGAGEMGGYLVRPAGVAGALPGIVVIHENRGLNPHIRDVARRAALAGYVALAPDALHPLGGYPGNDDEGRALQSQRDREEMVTDFAAAVGHLAALDGCTGKVGCVGFCFGGGVANALAARLPDLAAAVPFYGPPAPVEAVPGIRAPLLIHLAGLDTRINQAYPDYEAALKAAGKTYGIHVYDGANHGFHNDTTPRYDKAAAELAWSRTLTFFADHLG